MCMHAVNHKHTYVSMTHQELEKFFLIPHEAMNIDVIININNPGSMLM